MIKRQFIFGYPVMAATMPEVVGLCARSIADRKALQIGVLNAAKIVNGERDQVLKTAVLSCDVILADGQSVVWASKLLHQPLPTRLTGIDLFTELLRYGNQQKRSVYLLGATDDVQEAMLARIRSAYPDLIVAGSRNGYFTDDEAPQVAAEIAAAKPDMLFLGMTSPKKEIFIERYGHVLNVPVVHGVGGSFDILAGLTRRAPEAWQRAGLEWAYRLLQEPGRLWRRYLTTNVMFVTMVARELTRRRARPSSLLASPGRRALTAGERAA